MVPKSKLAQFFHLLQPPKALKCGSYKAYIVTVWCDITEDCPSRSVIVPAAVNMTSVVNTYTGVIPSVVMFSLNDAGQRSSPSNIIKVVVSVILI